jgi:branched-chain amino acid transport system substrate-binding protein
MNTQQTPTWQSPRRLKIAVALLVVTAICIVLAIKYFQLGPGVGTEKTEVLAVLPLSGGGASHGEFVREGFQMFAMDHPDSHLKVTIIDSESDPQKAVSGFEQQILLRKPRAAISVLSKIGGVLAPIAEKNKLLLIGVNTATDTFVQDYSVTQRINDRPADYAPPLAMLAAKRFQRVGVIYANESFALFCKDFFQSTFVQLNTNKLILEPYNLNDRDQSPVVQRMLSKQPEAVFVAGYGQPYISVFQTLRTFKYGGQVLADINFSNPEVLAALGDAAEGVIFAAIDFNVTPPSTRQAAAFLGSYRSRFQREPWLGSAFAYDALAILDHLERNKQPMVRQSIFALKEWPGIAAPLSFPSPGESRYVFQTVRRSAGKNVRLDLEKSNP